MLEIFLSSSAAERLRAADRFLARFSTATEVLIVGASREAADALAPATPLGAEAVAARVSFEAVQEGALEYFAPVARFPGFARALAATLVELRLSGSPLVAVTKLDGAGHDVAELA